MSDIEKIAEKYWKQFMHDGNAGLSIRRIGSLQKGHFVVALKSAITEACAARDAELAELRKDKERLDWLQIHRCGVDFFVMDDQDGEPTRDQWQVEGKGLESSRNDIRFAISAAMQNEKGKPSHE